MATPRKKARSRPKKAPPRRTRKAEAKQARFVEEYLVDLNATRAAKAAGYSPKTAYSAGQRLLKNVEIKAAIAKAQAERSQRTQITQDQVLQELAKVGFADIGDVLDFSGEDGVPRLRKVNAIPASARRAIASVKVKRQLEGRGEDAVEVELTEFKLWDKLAALRTIAQHLGMLVEKHDLTSGGETLPGIVVRAFGRDIEI